MYNLLEEEHPKPLETKAMTDSQKLSDASYFEMACSFLHHIAARTKIIPYTDMVKWVIDEANIADQHSIITGNRSWGLFSRQVMTYVQVTRAAKDPQ